MGTPTSPPSEPASLREKHLAKAKPPALGKRGPGGPDLGATDPNLKKFQHATSGGGGTGKTLLIILLFVVIAIVLLVGLAFFVPAVRALLPQAWQQAIEGPAPAPASLPVAPPPLMTPPAVTPPVATPTPPAPPVVPAVPAPAEKGTPSVK